MTKVEETISRIRELPVPLLDEVHGYVESLRMRRNPERWELNKPASVHVFSSRLIGQMS